MGERISNREYPPRVCLFCRNRFFPTDGRQKFCNTQHRVNYNNDLRKTRNKPADDFVKKLQHNEGILCKIFNRKLEYEQLVVDENLLWYEGFHFDVFSHSEKNIETGNGIYWSFNYGLEGMRDKSRYYMVYSKKSR